MNRIYYSILKWHLSRYQQMLFFAGPRQVGKTTVSKKAKEITEDFYYLNWDRDYDRDIIIRGQEAVETYMNLALVRKKLPIAVFDEIHKYTNWKNFLKGFYDVNKEKIHTIVTGSSRLDIFSKGGDSLMGRYFPYRVHPLSVAECLRSTLPENEISSPMEIQESLINQLLEFGGFPEPFLKADLQFLRNWKRLRQQQLFREDIRDLANIQEISQLELLAEILKHQAGQLLNLSNIAAKIGVAVNTVKRWLEILEKFYYCYLIRPYTINITRSLLKEPKVYLWDWSEVREEGKKLENFVAGHLLKAIHFWTDIGFGEYDLYFIRDKEKREVDFLVTKDKTPWFLIEVKKSKNASISESLYRFQKDLNCPHAFQVVFDAKQVSVNCFNYKEPVIVPAQTFLSQLV